MNNPYASVQNTNTSGEIDLDMSNYTLQDVLNIFDTFEVFDYKFGRRGL